MSNIFQSSKDFLGKGWKFPVTTNDNLEISGSEFEQNIKESILIILETRKMERVMRPDFGCGIHDIVFRNTDAATLGQLQTSIIEALTKFEPRIEILGIDISKEDLKDGKLIVKINYRVISTNNRFNLVYPFYIKEGD